MTAHFTLTRPWNYNSVVTACDECGGEGHVHALRQPTTDDPYPEMTCSACDGPQEPECAVCGSTTIVPGYDCIVCQTIGELPADMLTDKTANATISDLTRAITHAVYAATHAHEAARGAA